MKKLLRTLICFSLVISLFNVNIYAQSSKAEPGSAPTVLVTGFLCSKLYVNYGTDEEDTIWSDILSGIPSHIFSDITKVASSLLKFIKGENEAFGEAAALGALNLLENIRCNPDGTSVRQIGHYPNDPAVSNLEYMFENSSEYIYEVSFCEYLASVTDPATVFPFNYDSRIDAVTLADELNEYIDAVLEYTGAEKVNIFALSYGGLITSTYLSKYGEKNVVDRLVMAVPALGGTDIPDKILRGNIDLADEDLISFAETILGNESNFARIFKADRAEWLDEFAAGFCKNLDEIIVDWGSIWSLCSADLYDKLKADFLDEEENSVLIGNADYVQYTVRPNLTSIFNECRERGAEISLICGTGSSLVTGGGLNGDVILPASGVSGVFIAPLGSRFADGYKGAFTVCKNRTHCHLSPSMEVDASCAYLPENTWFVEGLYHGQYYYEEYTRSLITKLLYTDEIRDIYSDSDYPQFEYSSHLYRGIHAKFNDSSTGYLSSDDSSLIISSLSEDCYIKILSVVSDGVELDFDVSDTGILSPGENISVPFSGEIPSLGSTAAQITVSYIKIGSLTPLCVSEFDVTVNNGASSAQTDGYKSSDFETRLSKRVSEKTYDFLLKTSLVQAAECIYNTYCSIKDD